MLRNHNPTMDTIGAGNKFEVEYKLLCGLRIGQKVFVEFRTKLDHKDGRVKLCKPYQLAGFITCLITDGTHNEVSVHFDGTELPTGPFTPSDVLIS